MTGRLKQIRKIFQESTGTECSFISRAPGRINLIGEHTDYNMGLVMPAAIDRSVLMAFGPSGNKNCQFVANDLCESFEISIDKLQNTDIPWANYLIGILDAFQKKVRVESGFTCIITSDIPLGAGMSSSAALECAFVQGLNKLYNGQLDRWSLIDIIQESAHHFLGIKSGILDQFASLFGRKANAMMLDCGNKEFEYLDVKLKEYEFVLVDTKVKHTHLSSGYNDRVNECQSALDTTQSFFPDIQSLSDSKLSITQLNSLCLTEKELLRASFIIEENHRVIAFREALKKDDINAIGAILYASHEGLKNKYEVSCPELDFLVGQTYLMSYVPGARMMGGGFGGCTLNLVHNDFRSSFPEEISSKYLDSFGINPDIYSVSISDGATIINDND